VVFHSFSITENLHFIENVPTDILFNPLKIVTLFWIFFAAHSSCSKWKKIL